MMDPTREAMKRRVSKGLDIHITVGPSGDVSAKHGDGAPVDGDQSAMGSPDSADQQRKAIHAKGPDHPALGPDPQSDLAPDPGQDADVESQLMAGHENDTLTKPKTLGARVRAALVNKKKGI